MGFACYLPSLLKGTSSHLTLTEAPSSRCHQFPVSRARRQEGQRALAWSAEPEVPALGSCGGRRPAPRPYGPRRAARPGARGLRLPTPSLITAAPQLPGGHAHYLQDAAPASCRPCAFWNGSPGSEGRRGGPRACGHVPWAAASTAGDSQATACQAARQDLGGPRPGPRWACRRRTRRGLRPAPRAERDGDRWGRPPGSPLCVFAPRASF